MVNIEEICNLQVHTCSRIRYVLFLFIFFIPYLNLAQKISPIIPTPKIYDETEGFISIEKFVFFNDDDIPKNISQFFSYELNKHYNILKKEDKEIPTILFTKKILSDNSTAINLPKDFYSISVKNHIEVKYTSDASCFYAVNSLLQLIEGETGKWFIKKCQVEDSPKFQWRGLHLDVSRHFFSVDEIKKFIQLMSYYKFNTFHWHLTDDQGWRIEIKKYPELTKIGAFRDSTIEEHYSKKPRSYTVEKYGGFYTQDEIKEVVSYAKSRYINIVPEIEMPGHSRSALAAYPQFSCNGFKKPVPGLWGIFEDIYCSKEESILFIQDILKEVIDLFPFEYIHIGGDEAPKKRWKSCSSCQKVIIDNDLANEEELQSYFIKRMDDFLMKKGKKLIGWDEILEGGLSANATVMSWRGDKGGKEAASQGHYVVMSPNTHCYFDYYQSSHFSEPLAIGGYLPLEKVYNFNPIPKGMNEIDAKYILGGQANIWTEYITSIDQVEYMAYPRSLALIQNLWCNVKPSFDDFLHVYLNKHQEYLNKHDVNYSNSIHIPKLNISRKENGINFNFTSAYESSKFDVLIKSSNKKYVLKSKKIDARDSIFIPKSKPSERIPININIKSNSSKVASDYTILVTDVLGAEVTLLTAPSLKYNNNGSLNLVDGIHGRKPWKGSEWLGFNRSNIEFVLDLGEQRDLNGFRLGILEDNGSWIYMPEKIEIFSSKNKNNWISLNKLELKKCKSKFGMKEIPFKSKTRYLKVIINSMEKIPDGKNGSGHSPWTFIDEIEVF